MHAAPFFPPSSQGLSYVLTRPATLEPNSRELAVAWSSDVYPPLPPNGKLEVTGVHLDLQTVRDIHIKLATSELVGQGL